jgi:hypothetical protein
MRLVLTLSMLFVLMIAPVFAQSDTAEPVVCEGAQEYYDDLDPDNVVMLSASVAIGGDRASARLRAVEAIREFAETMTESEYPDCMAVAVDWYVDAMEYLATALEAFVDGETGEFTLGFTKAGQLIGQWRGYMAAVGVEITPDGETIQYR